MLELKRIQMGEEFDKGVEALTSIFIDEYPYYSKWIAKNINQFIKGEKQILSVEDDGKILGYFMIHFCTNKIVKINGIYIFEEYKGKGFASMALLKLIEELKQNLVDLIYVQTRLDNNAVVHLFDKTGFELVGTNYHRIEQKNNWVACNRITSLPVDEQQIALSIYDGFCPLTKENVHALREEHKNGNLVLTRTKIKGE